MQKPLTHDDYYQYMRLVRSAKLQLKEKALLRTYADWYWWQTEQPCIYGFPQLAAWTGMSESTVKRAHKRLEELEWITVVKFGVYAPLRVYPAVGNSDPEYDKQGYAKAHRYSDREEELIWREAYLNNESCLEEVSAPRRSYRPKKIQKDPSKSTPTFRTA